MTRDQDSACAAGSAVSGTSRPGSGSDGGNAQPGDAHGQEASPLTVLVDDVRRFRDGRDCEVARTSAQGVRLLTRLRAGHIDHLWLDHDLGGDDTIWPVVRLLEDAHLAGHPFDIGLVHVHAARTGAAHQMVISMRRAAYAVERSYNLRMWTW